MAEEEGRWITVMGRALYLAEGESLSDAMRKSGKFAGAKYSASENAEVRSARSRIKAKEDEYYSARDKEESTMKDEDFTESYYKARDKKDTENSIKLQKEYMSEQGKIIAKTDEKYAELMNKTNLTQQDKEYMRSKRSELDNESFSKSKSSGFYKSEIADIETLPTAAQDKLKSFRIVNKSPYSQSFYDSDNIGWDSKPEGSLRLADHWGFQSKGSVHCKIKGSDKYETGWKLGVYSKGEYIILEDYGNGD